MRRQSINMCEGPIFSNIIRYTVPIILSSVLQLLFNAADLIVVGRFCGNKSVAAVGATTSLINLMINLFIGISIGAGVVVAQGIGAKNDKKVFNMVHTAIPSGLIFGIVLSFVGFTFSKTFLNLMGTPDNIIGLSALYLKIYSLGIVANIVYNFGSAILRAVGDTKNPLWYLTVSGIINVILNIVFVTIVKLDVAGVAIATTVSQFVSAILVIMNLCRRKDICHFSFSKMRIHFPSLKKMIVIGLPAGIQTSMFSIANVIIQSSINTFNNSALLSGNAAADNINGFTVAILNSYMQTSINFVGQNHGARNYERIKKIVLACAVCIVITSAIICIPILIFKKQLLSIYITDSVKAINYGMIKMSILTGFYVFDGLMSVYVGGLRGLGKATEPMIISIFCICVFRVVWIYTVFQKFHTISCIYYSYPISWIIGFTAQILLFYYMLKKCKSADFERALRDKRKAEEKIEEMI